MINISDYVDFKKWSSENLERLKSNYQLKERFATFDNFCFSEYAKQVIFEDDNRVTKTESEYTLLNKNLININVK
jgi:hypothetical protein